MNIDEVRVEVTPVATKRGRAYLTFCHTCGPVGITEADSARSAANEHLLDAHDRIAI